MFKKNLFILGVLGAIITPVITSATTVSVLNHNFESDAIPITPGYTTSISGWVKNGVGEIGAHIPDKDIDYLDTGGRGQVAYLNAAGKMYNAPAAKIVSGETYTLTFDVGRALSQTNLSMIARIKANGLSLVQVQLNKTQIEAGTWETHNLTFTATDDMPIGSKLVIEFQNLSFDAASRVDVDNVKLMTSIKEPLKPFPRNLSIINAATTLSVPSEHDNVKDALEYLSDKYITSNAIVTIDVDDCSNESYSFPIDLVHPQGKQIEIIGNTTDPAACVMQFDGSSGFTITNNRQVKRINGFHIKGNRVNKTDGVSATKGASLSLGASTKVTGFYNGINATYGGRVYANTVLVSQNAGSGIVAQYGGYVQANGSQSNENTLHGYLSADGGVMEALNSKASKNDYNGYFADTFGVIKGDNAIASGNLGSAFFASSKGILDVPSSSTSNDFVGYQCASGGQINQANSSQVGTLTLYIPEVGVYDQNCLIQ